MKAIDSTTEIISNGNAIWKSWAAMWNGNVALADRIIKNGFILHLTGASKDNPETIRNADDVKDMVRRTRAKYLSLHYATVAGAFIDIQQLVITAHWKADIIFAGRTDSPFDLPGKPFKLVGTDILKFYNGQIYECWTMNNPGK